MPHNETPTGGQCARFKWITSIATALAASRRITSTTTALAAMAAAVPAAAVGRQIDFGFPFESSYSYPCRNNRVGLVASSSATSI
jgi:hypothetical protein